MLHLQIFCESVDCVHLGVDATGKGRSTKSSNSHKSHKQSSRSIRFKQLNWGPTSLSDRFCLRLSSPSSATLRSLRLDTPFASFSDLARLSSGTHRRSPFPGRTPWGPPSGRRVHPCRPAVGSSQGVHQCTAQASVPRALDVLSNGIVTVEEGILQDVEARILLRQWGGGVV